MAGPELLLRWRVSIAGMAVLTGILALPGLTGCARPPEPVTGAVVLRCKLGRGGARSELEAGDIVVAWRRGDRRGPIGSPFDLAFAEQREVPHGRVVLTVRRGRRNRDFAMAPGVWGLDTRPTLPPELLALHERALGLVGDGELDRAVSLQRTIASRMKKAGRPAAAAWCRLQAALPLAKASRGEEAQDELKAGAALMADPSLRAIYWERAGNAFLESGWTKAAGKAFTSSLELHETVDGESPAVAFTLLQLCRAGRRTHGPEARKALAIYRALEGDGMETARALEQLASQLLYRSQYDRAEALSREALAIVKKQAPDAKLLPELLGGLGLAVFHQGELEAAREVFHRELGAAERFAPAGLQAGLACNHLGLVAKYLGEYQEARSWYLRALAIYRARRPGGVEVAGMLNNLGNVAMRQEDLAGALRYHKQALDLRQRLHPGGADVAASLNNVGSIERQMGDLNAARGYLEKVLELKRKIAPGTWTLANTLTELGMTAAKQKRHVEAGRLYAEALAIRERLAPGSPGVAEILFLRGSLAKQEGRRLECERLWRRAIAIAESKEGELSLSEQELSRFGARFYLFYGALARLLLNDGRGEEAFTVIERARARALRSMIIGAQSIPAGVPGRLWSAYRQVLRKIDRARTEQARKVAAGRGATGSTDLAGEIGQLETSRNRLERDVVTAAPRLASFEAAPAPTLKEVRQALDRGTVLLSYIVGEDQTALFVVGAAGSKTPPRTFTIPAGSTELERRVEILRALIARGRVAATVDSALVAQARKLFQLLVAPANKEIEPARRLLIVPDGPLRDAPFAALVLPGDPVRFLGTWKPIFFNPSAGAFMALKARRQLKGRGSGVIAIGDADYPEDSEVVRALHLKPLAGSRYEVRRIAARFGERARVYMGRDATEQRLRSLPGGARFLHLAVHAHSDARFPLQSALFFSIPVASATAPDRDGVLHAWEIMDDLHLDVDVVTLSACSTSCGERVAGEGVLGLARAFEYAGANTLVASQWPVADRSTCELMDRFYEGLRAGLSTAEALQKAQQTLAELPLRLENGTTLDTRHPFNWAAFQVIGDWR